ncbi:hypothetical protein [Corynebacterium doosanense]|uniref:Membrane protein n=1 Tax=Corynebacterium doosanense CAU 212 = DSM 45436 TaxID=558173 RepID=A0A097IF69_9CORY|nr:hypothetical protein [Corynebacterium doosanense]AIT60773.1 membrane protein [Corynebacterium doosanense CAU 212 = DSM 45436]
MSDSVIRDSFSRGEQIGGLAWLSVGALISLILEIVYLGTRVTLPGGVSMALPWTIAAAVLMNAVFTRTARLWSTQTWVALVPLGVWCLGFLVFLALPALSGDQLLGNNMRTIALLFAGIGGGLWPLTRTK